MTVYHSRFINGMDSFQLVVGYCKQSSCFHLSQKESFYLMNGYLKDANVFLEQAKEAFGARDKGSSNVSSV